MMCLTVKISFSIYCHWGRDEGFGGRSSVWSFTENGMWLDKVGAVSLAFSKGSEVAGLHGNASFFLKRFHSGTSTSIFTIVLLFSPLSCGPPLSFGCVNHQWGIRRITWFPHNGRCVGLPQMCEACSGACYSRQCKSFVVRSERSPLNCLLTVWSDFGGLGFCFVNLIIVSVNPAPYLHPNDSLLFTSILHTSYIVYSPFIMYLYSPRYVCPVQLY